MSNHLEVPGAETRRKFSIPVSVGSLLPEGSPGLSARRRLSNVSDAVTRKLSTTIGLGWRGPAILSQDIIEQGKYLCSQYIRARLKRSGLFTRKLGLQRLRSVVGTPSGHVVRAVFPVLSEIGAELERMHPRVYCSVSRQASRAPGGTLQSAETAPALLGAVARNLFKTGVTWGKIVSLYAVCGGLAVDCVRQGHPDFLPKLIEGTGEVIEDELTVWIAANGGWTALSNKYQHQNEDFTLKQLSSIVLAVIAIIMLVYVSIKTIVNITMPFLLHFL